jgi:RNA polymerase sigma factor (TIGR02999 family)
MPDSASDGHEVTALLGRLSGGNPEAADALAPLIYSELHRLAVSCMRRERTGHTLQPTALVNEAYLRLVGQREVQWKSRAHFYGIAGQIMRRILLDFARKRLSAKRGGAGWKVTLDEGMVIAEDRLDDILLIDAALNRLAQLDERQSRIVELRFFAGLSFEETAAALELSTITVKRDWNSAKAWLYREIAKARPNESGTVAAG